VRRSVRQPERQFVINLHAGIHGLFADVLIALGAGHLLVTLFHQFVLRDNLLARMRPR